MMKKTLMLVIGLTVYANQEVNVWQKASAVVVHAYSQLPTLFSSAVNIEPVELKVAGLKKTEEVKAAVISAFKQYLENVQKSKASHWSITNLILGHAKENEIEHILKAGIQRLKNAQLISTIAEAVIKCARQVDSLSHSHTIGEQFRTMSRNIYALTTVDQTSNDSGRGFF